MPCFVLLSALLVGGVAIASANEGGRTHIVTPDSSLDASVIHPGDTVLFRPGQYSRMPPLVSGEPGRPVTYRAEEPGAAIFDGTGEGRRPELLEDQWESQITLDDEGRRPWAGWPRRLLDVKAEDLDQLSGNMIRLDGVSHVRIQGLVVRNTRTGIFIMGGARDVVLEDIEIYQTRLAMRVNDLDGFKFRRMHLHHNHKGIFFDDGNARNGLLEYVVAEYNDDGRGRAGDGDGFQMRAGVSNITFRHCVARRNGEDGFDFKGANITAEYCIASQNGGTGIKTWNRGLRLKNVAAWGNTRGLAVGNFYPFRDNEREFIRDISVINSTVAGNRWVGVALSANMEIELRNNIFDASTGGVAMATWQWRGGASESEYHQAPRIVAANAATPEAIEGEMKGTNLIWANRDSAFVAYQDHWVSPSDLRQGDWAVMGDGVRFVLEDPGFVDLEAGDVRLTAGSRAIGAGESAFAPSHDLEGVERPQGTGVDLGAYEFTD
jgi:hypothetical protein